MTEYASTPQIELVEGDPVPLLTRGLPTGLEALVGLALGKAIGTSDVAGAKTIGPGTQGGASRASSPGRSSNSQTVAVRPRGGRAMVTAHRQPS